MVHVVNVGSILLSLAASRLNNKVLNTAPNIKGVGPKMLIHQGGFLLEWLLRRRPRLDLNPIREAAAETMPLAERAPPSDLVRANAAATRSRKCCITDENC